MKEKFGGVSELSVDDGVLRESQVSETARISMASSRMNS
jgi:hypothetical protein